MLKRTFIKYLILSIAIIILAKITNIVFDFRGLLYTSLAEKLTNKQIQHIFELQDKWEWVSYIFVPIILLIKTSLITCVLYIGTFFFSKIQVSFKQVWDFVVNADFTFLLVPIFKIIWFYFFQTNYKLEDIQYFYPLSTLNIVGYKNLESWYIYPFQTLNLFELAYWLILAYQIGKATETNMDQGLKIVAYSYGPALLLWVVTIMFFTLNYS
ncbi:hypothetical protein AB3G34_13740 [Flavobacterium sp. WC2409]|uniref:Yip1 domain-containing protein n=1 Tax=Flavobacterium sp. WC2409 TaxID=3234139 RepID=A0AB39W0X1_9FLAO